MSDQRMHDAEDEPEEASSSEEEEADDEEWRSYPIWLQAAVKEEGQEASVRVLDADDSGGERCSSAIRAARPRSVRSAARCPRGAAQRMQARNVGSAAARATPWNHPLTEPPKEVDGRMRIRVKVRRVAARSGFTAGEPTPGVRRSWHYCAPRLPRTRLLHASGALV